MSITTENYCIDCKSVAQPDCDARGHIVGTLGQSSNEPPAPRAGERDEWEYRETRYGAEARAGQFAIRLHWTGLADIGDTRATVKQIVTEHNQHATLIEQRERLLESLRKLAAFDDAGGNMVLRKQGDYSGFDEPGAVQVARETLATIEREGEA